MLRTTYFLELRLRDWSRPSEPMALDLVAGPDLTPLRYRAIYKAVGAPWGWSSRLGWSDSEIMNHLSRYDREVRLLHLEGEDIGFFAINFEPPYQAEIIYFGLVMKVLGHGYGRSFFLHALDCIQRRGVQLARIKTSNTDHPNALQLYKKLGFSIKSIDKGTAAQ